MTENERNLRNIFGKKEPASCTACGKELGRHRYRPAKEWNIAGFLCSDCHVDKTREYMEKQSLADNAPDECAICHREITKEEDRNKPKWQWEMESGLLLCKSCYERKDADYTKKMNFCVSCNARLGRFFYHPKPAWKIEGNLCRQCWDARNGGG